MFYKFKTESQLNHPLGDISSCKQTFMNPSTKIFCTNKIGVEITNWLNTANRSHSGLNTHINLKLLPMKTKIQLYKTLLKPIMIYGSKS